LQTLITKVDESDGAGAVLNAAAILGRPVAGITDGQRVPEDLHEFEPQCFAARVGL
jgi:flagellar biosynthesis protein FlhF